MSKILKLRGASALSDFRLAKLLPQLNSVHPGVKSVAAEFRHFVEVLEPLDAPETELLAPLLPYPPPLPTSSHPARSFLVVPPA